MRKESNLQPADFSIWLLVLGMHVVICGVVAWIFGLNPTLSPDNVIGILTNTAVQLGSPLYYGWGRIDFGAAARLTEDRDIRWVAAKFGDVKGPRTDRICPSHSG